MGLFVALYLCRFGFWWGLVMTGAGAVLWWWPRCFPVANASEARDLIDLEIYLVYLIYLFIYTLDYPVTCGQKGLRCGLDSERW